MSDVVLVADNHTKAEGAVAWDQPAPFVTAKDGARLFVQDWRRGRTILFATAWALSSGFWGSAAVAMQRRGFRGVAFDQRGHGRSDPRSDGYDANTLADDLAAVIETRDLDDVVLVTHSMGAGEAVRYLSRHGAARMAKLLLVAPTTP